MGIIKHVLMRSNGRQARLVNGTHGGGKRRSADEDELELLRERFVSRPVNISNNIQVAYPNFVTMLAAATVLGGASPTLAHSSGLEPAFGNTIVSTHPDGRQARLWLSAYHTFRAQGRGGNRSSGVWRVRGDQLCLTQRRPLPIPISYCHRFSRHSVGDRWNDTASNGDAVVNQIVPGQ